MASCLTTFLRIAVPAIVCLDTPAAPRAPAEVGSPDDGGLVGWGDNELRRHDTTSETAIRAR